MSRGNSPVVSSFPACRVLFDRPVARIGASADRPDELQIALPVLGGASDEVLLSAADNVRRAGSFTLFGGRPVLAGFAVAPAGLDLEAAAGKLYDDLFAAARGLHFYRIWNYVPQINAVEQGLENYRRFCRGRSLAFERHFGAGFRKLLPAASAVGALTGPLALGFLAGDAVPEHFENPRQVPAFEYPPQYGPRPPSFARATAVTLETGRQVIISGTAAISGHASVASGNLDRQIDCTFENLSLIGAAAGAGRTLGPDGSWLRRFKVYIRNAADFAQISRRLDASLLRPGDVVQYLQADLCRTELLVEIEAILSEVL